MKIQYFIFTIITLTSARFLIDEWAKPKLFDEHHSTISLNSATKVAKFPVLTYLEQHGIYKRSASDDVIDVLYVEFEDGGLIMNNFKLPDGYIGIELDGLYAGLAHINSTLTRRSTGDWIAAGLVLVHGGYITLKVGIAAAHSWKMRDAEIAAVQAGMTIGTFYGCIGYGFVNAFKHRHLQAGWVWSTKFF